MEKINRHDFVEIDYTGRLIDGIVFDTTIEHIAKENKIYAEKKKYGSLIICVGEKQLLPGLDDQLIDKEIGKEYIINLSADKAFGKRDIKKMRILPLGTFKDHKLNPQPGLQIDVDGEMGTITSISGGRVIVNFNHPLAGKEVIYEVKVNRKVTNPQQQLKAFLTYTLGLPDKNITVESKEDKVSVELPFALPAPFIEALSKRLVELTSLTEVIFTVKGQEDKRELAEENK